MKHLLLGILLLAFCLPCLAGEYPKQGDVILTAGYAVAAPRDATDQRTSGLYAGLEGFVADHFSLGLSVSQADTEASQKAYTLTLNPRWGNVYFPVGLYGVEVPDRNTPSWGGTAGAGIDFWNSDHFGLTLSGHYNYLQKSVVAQDFYEARGGIRLRF